MTRRPRVSRFQLRDSDRSGFTSRHVTLVRDSGRLVAPDEYDQPPPSRLGLGGEGERSTGARVTAEQFTVDFTTAAAVTVTAINSSTALSPVLPDLEDRTGNVGLGYMAIVGSLEAQTMAVSPQIVAGRERQVLTLECVGSSVTFVPGSGLTLMGTVPFRMDSGSILTLLYNSANTTWTETSRTR